ncbi:chloride nucleotide-sensitive channel icln [Rhynchophorus ferrugineus]|uniref:chloride nucleotide-sensitive channel icln n=1 Tax=Rhynchophorus ferrugineus TaxID=354439 RepID=UPI003FCD7849
MVISNSFSFPESNIKHEQRNIRAILDKTDLGLGTLIISESTLCWQEKDNVGFSLGYQDISLHAISKDENVYHRECIYIMVDGRIYMPGQESQNEDEDDDNSETESSELIFVPEVESSDSIRTIYEAIKVCQELNPDPDDMDEDDDDDDDNLYADAEDELEEGHYIIHDRGDGDAEINELSRRLEENSVEMNYIQNGNEDDEFQDAD